MGCCQAPASCKQTAYTKSANGAKNVCTEVETTEIDITNDDAIPGESYEEVKIAPSAGTDRIDEPYKARQVDSYQERRTPPTVGSNRIEDSIKASEPRSFGANALDLDNSSPQKVHQRIPVADAARTAINLPANEAERSEKRGWQAATEYSGRHKSVEDDGDEPPLLEALGQKNTPWKYGALAGSLVMRGDTGPRMRSDDSDSDGSDWMEAKRRSLARAEAEQKELELLSTDMEDTRVDLADLDKDLMFETTLKRSRDI